MRIFISSVDGLFDHCNYDVCRHAAAKIFHPQTLPGSSLCHHWRCAYAGQSQLLQAFLSNCQIQRSVNVLLDWYRLFRSELLTKEKIEIKKHQYSNGLCCSSIDKWIILPGIYQTESLYWRNDIIVDAYALIYIRDVVFLTSGSFR